MSNFLEEISSLSHSIVFLYFFALIAEEDFLTFLSLLFFGTLHSNGYIFPFLLLTSLLFSAICKAVPEELWMEVCDIVQETGIKTIPLEKKSKEQNGCLGRPYK